MLGKLGSASSRSWSRSGPSLIGLYHIVPQWLLRWPEVISACRKARFVAAAIIIPLYLRVSAPTAVRQAKQTLSLNPKT